MDRLLSAGTVGHDPRVRTGRGRSRGVRPGLWCGPTAAEPADPYHFRRDRGIRTSRPRSAAHDLLLALVRLRRSAQPRVLGGGARARDLQRIRGGRAGAFRRGQPAERPA